MLNPVQQRNIFFLCSSESCTFAPENIEDMITIEELNQLKTLGNIPFEAYVLRNILSRYQSPEKKILQLVRDGYIIRIKQGLYVVSPEVSGKLISRELIANHIYGPSYVSAHYALRHYGLIPEWVTEVTSVTTRHTRRFETPEGFFSYRQVNSEYFPIGIQMASDDDQLTFLIATPEKALCDMIMVEPHIQSQSLSALVAFLEEDMRIDTDELKDMNRDIIRKCMETGNKKQILANLIKLMER